MNELKEQVDDLKKLCKILPERQNDFSKELFGGVLCVLDCLLTKLDEQPKSEIKNEVMTTGLSQYGISISPNAMTAPTENPVVSSLLELYCLHCGESMFRYIKDIKTEQDLICADCSAKKSSLL